MIRVNISISRTLRLLIIVSVLAGIVSAASATPSSDGNAGASAVTVVVGGKPVPFVVPPYLDSDGQVYVPVDLVHLMGGTYAPNPDGKTVQITTASGSTFPAPFQFVQSRFCVPLQRYADQLGATVVWDARSRTLTFRAKLVMVRADSGGLTITTTYPVYYKVNKLDKANKLDPERRIYVDLYGVDLAASPATIPSSEPGIAFIRTGHLDDDTARVVVDLRRRLTYQVDSPVSTSQVHVAMTGLAATPASSRVANATRPDVRHPAPNPVAAPSPTVPAIAPASVAPLPVTVPGTATASGETPSPTPSSAITAPVITGITYNVVSPDVTEISVKSSSATKYRWITLDQPYRLAFDLAGAGLDSGLQMSQTVPSTVVKDVRAGTINAGKAEFGRVVIDLSQSVDFSVTTQQVADGMIYTISIQRPTVEAPLASLGHELSGKVIMVDPGHGADDTGAIDTIGGFREKDFNLAIAKKVRDTLARHGATVYMTREDDIKPSLKARPQMAIAVGADFFISIHCDESGARESHTGTTVYFHAQNETCRQLALNIVDRVGAVSGLPANGVKSDTIRFHTGFAVLRGSPMPAVLVECGYMNNTADVAKLRTDEVQQHIAEGIVSGLIDFITAHG